MTKTEHYNLPQWEATDRVLREDFNEAFDNIDTALAEIQAALPKPEVMTGTYIGTNDSDEPTVIPLGFQPTAVLINAAASSFGNQSALILPNAGISYNGRTMAEITENGFTVATVIYSGMTLTPHLNADQLYGYVAFR